MSNRVNPNFFSKLQACDVKEIVACNGRATLHGQKCEFKYPSCNDAVLCTILQDNKCTLKIVGSPEQDCCTYEVCGHGKTCQIKIACC